MSDTISTPESEPQVGEAQPSAPAVTPEKAPQSNKATSSKKAKSQRKILILILGIWIGVFLGAGAIIAIFLTGGLPLGGSGASDESAMVVESDSPAPDFALPDLSGNVVQLTDFRGKVIVLNFWATWCGPCVEEMPMFQKYQDQYPDMVMIGVDAEEKPQTVIDFLSDKGLSYLMLVDEKAVAGDLYQVLVLPTTYFIDEEGVIRFRHIGVLNEAQLEAYLGSLGVLQ